ncbi:hypothetical protein CHS0354_015602 [Potamilus streckersoni]|uniref:Voltage-gated hydrogen channel 1 n=1 Tax=Potamilus streckersoni TaxID=2493646 RepID=A0AAE0TCL0_9BIVA|nr:hypothetical protein CHS0354_015602 [Potamilus streckersoni]
MPRKSSLKHLVAESLLLARSHAPTVLQETERKLERELREDSIALPSSKIARYRRKGGKLLHTKLVLLIIVLLNIIDCILVLGELILDIHYVKELIETSDESFTKFVVTMKQQYPTELSHFSVQKMDDFFVKIASGNCSWTSHVPVEDLHVSVYSNDTRKRSVRDTADQSRVAGVKTARENDGHGRSSNSRSENRTMYASSMQTGNSTNFQNSSKSNFQLTIDKSPLDQYHIVQEEDEIQHERSIYVDTHHSSQHKEHSLDEIIAHALHKASIMILSVLVLETCLKVLCQGLRFFRHKLEVFDAIIVIGSFVVDLVFLKGLTSYKIHIFVYVLTFLLPWRVIRVVNSLVVAVRDHEHFRLKLIYQQKKKGSIKLREYKDREKLTKSYVNTLEAMMDSYGVPKWRVQKERAIHMRRMSKQSPISALGALTVGTMLSGSFCKKMSIPGSENNNDNDDEENIDDYSDLAFLPTESCDPLSVIEETDSMLSADFDCEIEVTENNTQDDIHEIGKKTHDSN